MSDLFSVENISTFLFTVSLGLLWLAFMLKLKKDSDRQAKESERLLDHLEKHIKELLDEHKKD